MTAEGTAAERLATKLANRWREVLLAQLRFKKLDEVAVSVEVITGEEPGEQGETYQATFDHPSGVRFYSAVVRRVFFDEVFTPRWHALSIVNNLKERLQEAGVL